jgi:hypothetical protein
MQYVMEIAVLNTSRTYFYVKYYFKCGSFLQKVKIKNKPGRVVGYTDQP